MKWTKPYFDCGKSNKWIISAVSPIVDVYPRHTEYRNVQSFRYLATSVASIDFIMMDINQCDDFHLGQDQTQTTKNYFAGTHKCKRTTRVRQKKRKLNLTNVIYCKYLYIFKTKKNSSVNHLTRTDFDAVVTNACVNRAIAIRLIRTDLSRAIWSKNRPRRNMRKISIVFQLIVRSFYFSGYLLGLYCTSKKT